ncbi:hypothetical protein MUP77_06170 [Candidatus Bathyarchaeota archaeon]|nr:hypothetical protein [Candidatus Bathyarchaeota archaeon]
MVRPKDSSYRSYSVILDVLDERPRSFDEFWKLTKLHRNTVSSRLKHLVSEGLVTKTRQKHRILYAMVEPMDATKWSELSWRIMKEIGKRKLMKVITEWMKMETASGLTKLENLPESQDLLESRELLEGFPEWKELSPDEYRSMLRLHIDLIKGLICPECFSIGTIVEDYFTHETVCKKCASVIEEDSVSLEKRAKAISSLLKNMKDNVNDGKCQT